MLLKHADSEASLNILAPNNISKLRKMILLDNLTWSHIQSLYLVSAKLRMLLREIGLTLLILYRALLMFMS